MNKVVLMGRLTRDPETRYTTSNTLVATFSLAVNRRFSKTGEADFINIVAWDKTGEFASKYFKKGQQVAVIGRIQTRNYENQNGQRVYVTEVVAEELYFADSKRGDSTGSQEDNSPIEDPFKDMPQVIGNMDFGNDDSGVTDDIKDFSN